MKSSYFKDGLVKVGLIIFFIFSISLIFSTLCLSEEPLPILVVERDVPQVFNHTAIVNHTAYVVNLSDTACKVTLESVIPENMYRKSKSYPRFGKDAQLDMPMYYPSQVEIKNFNVLGEPEIEKKIDEVSYIWRDISIQAHQAAIIYFDNYLGKANMFHAPDGFKISGLSVITDYRASMIDENVAQLSLNYTIKNISNQKIEFLQFELFFPDTIMNVGENGKNIRLFDVAKYCLSSGVQIQPWIIKDGFGNMAQGNSIFIQWKTLDPGEEHQFFAVFTGTKKYDKGEIYPLLIINCRMDGTKLLQPTTIESKKNISIGRFYYTQYSTAIPDSKLFKFEKEKIKVVAAKEVQKPTFATFLPEEVPSGPVIPPAIQKEEKAIPQTLLH